MAQVVTFVDYTPPPRYDGVKWTQFIIQESSDGLSGWATIETRNISDYPNPAAPPTLNFTTEVATLLSGWYQIIFLDASGDQSQPTVPVQNVIDETSVYAPTVSQVAALLRARTKNAFSVELGNFTDETRPTDEQVRDIIPQAMQDVATAVGSPIPAVYRAEALALSALRAAMLIELGYFPEQIVTGRSPFEQMRLMYEDQIERLVVRVSAVGDPELSSAGAGKFTFDDVVLVGWYTRW